MKKRAAVARRLRRPSPRPWSTPGSRLRAQVLQYTLMSLFLLLLATPLVIPPCRGDSDAFHSNPRSHPDWRVLDDPSLVVTNNTSVKLVIALAHPQAQQLETVFNSISSPSSPTYRAFLDRSALATFLTPDISIQRDVEHFITSTFGLNTEEIKWTRFRDSIEIHVNASLFRRHFHCDLHHYAAVNNISRNTIVSTRNGSELIERLPLYLQPHIHYIGGVASFPLRTLRPSAAAYTMNISSSVASWSSNTVHYDNPDNSYIFSTPKSSGVLSLYIKPKCPDGHSPATPFIYDSRVYLKCSALYSDYYLFSSRLQYSYASETDYTSVAETMPEINVIVISATHFVYQYDLSIKNYLPVRLTVTQTWVSLSSSRRQIESIIDYRYTPFAVQPVVPDLIKSYYGVSTLIEVNGIITQAVGAIYLSANSPGCYSEADLNAFSAAHNLPPQSQYAQFITEHYVNCSSAPSQLETELDIQFLMGVSPGIQSFVFDADQDSTNPFLDICRMALSQPVVPSVLSLSYGLPEPTRKYPEIDAADDCFKALGAIGTTVLVASGDNGAYDSDTLKCNALVPDWPASSPYVTSVGATQLESDGRGVLSEIACSGETGSLITTGGGFSNIYPRPNYQNAAVLRYLQFSSKLPELSFNRHGRAYPDISLLGQAYEIYYEGSPTLVDGTSAAAPTLAGLLSQINARLGNAGYAKLGFLNPTLYSLAESPSNGVFQDVIRGNNRCRSQFECCSSGFEAAPNFDAAAGLGSLRIDAFIRALAPQLPYTTTQSKASIVPFIVPAMVAALVFTSMALIFIRFRRRWQHSTAEVPVEQSNEITQSRRQSSQSINENRDLQPLDHDEDEELTDINDAHNETSAPVVENAEVGEAGV